MLFRALQRDQRERLRPIHSKYREIEYEEVEYEKPEVILDKIEALEDQIKANVAELRRLLVENSVLAAQQYLLYLVEIIAENETSL